MAISRQYLEARISKNSQPQKNTEVKKGEGEKIEGEEEEEDLPSRSKNLNSIGVRDGVGGQGQYRLGRGSIGWARAVSAVPLPKSDFQHIKKVF